MEGWSPLVVAAIIPGLLMRVIVLFTVVMIVILLSLVCVVWVRGAPVEVVAAKVEVAVMVVLWLRFVLGDG